MHQGDEGRSVARAPRDRVAGAADRQARARAARQYPPGGDREGPARARRLGDGADRARRLSARGRHLGDAAGAQEVRPVRRGAPGAVACRDSIDPQGRRHRLPARAHRGNALFRDGRRRLARVPAQRRHHRRDAGDHPQRIEPGGARGVRDRPHPQAQEGHRRPQGAGLSARLRHVRRGMPQGRARLSGRDVRGDDDRLDRDEAGHGAAAVRRGRDDQPVRRHPDRYRRRPGRRARPGARSVRRRAAGDGAGDPRLGPRHFRARYRQSLRHDHVGSDAARLARPQARRAEGRRRRRPHPGGGHDGDRRGQAPDQGSGRASRHRGDGETPLPPPCKDRDSG